MNEQQTCCLTASGRISTPHKWVAAFYRRLCPLGFRVEHRAYKKKLLCWKTLSIGLIYGIEMLHYLTLVTCKLFIESVPNS